MSADEPTEAECATRLTRFTRALLFLNDSTQRLISTSRHLDISTKGAIGFDEDNDLIAAYRGPLAHVKTRGTHNCER